LGEQRGPRARDGGLEEVVEQLGSEQRWRVSMRWGVWTVALDMRVIVTAYLPLLPTFAASEEDIPLLSQVLQI
jgi:hypothetical protein